MSQHVYAWVTGFGWTIMPFAPYSMEQLPGEPPQIKVIHTGPSPAPFQNVIVTIAGESAERVPASANSECPYAAELIQGAAFAEWSHEARFDHWRIETYPFSIRWPRGFILRSVAESPPPAFELCGVDNSMIWIQGPFAENTLPPLDQLAGSGQTVLHKHSSPGGPIVELIYTHQGQSWTMFHCVIDRFPQGEALVSAQTPTTHRQFILDSVIAIAVSLQPSQNE